MIMLGALDSALGTGRCGMSNDAILNHDMERALPRRSSPACYDFGATVQPVFPNFHARRLVRNLPRGSDAAVYRLGCAQVAGGRRIRGYGAGGADLLRAARVELR